LINTLLYFKANQIVFGQGFWRSLLSLTPSFASSLATWPFSSACKAVPAGAVCTLPALLEGGRSKVMSVFSMQRRMLPVELLGSPAGSIGEAGLTAKYCGVRVAGKALCGDLSRVTGYYSMPDKYSEFAAVAARVIKAYDTNSDAKLTLDELQVATGVTDGKLSLASLDPGTGSLFSLGTLWNLFIASLILFFIYSIVEQVALTTQQGYDAAEVEALEASLFSKTAKDPAASKKKKSD